MTGAARSAIQRPDAERELAGPCGIASAYSVRRVLVADDNDFSRQVFREVLEQMGCLVWEACDGPAAVLTTWRVLPDLIFLDLCMPGIDGFEVLREIRRTPEFAVTPIVALTAGALNGDCEKALAAGFTRYLARPVSPDTLRAELERVFG